LIAPKASCSVLGVGKTHLTIALGYLATQKSWKTHFFRAVDLVLMFEAAQTPGALPPDDESRSQRL
jgi:DNA replication protein DnaC